MDNETQILKTCISKLISKKDYFGAKIIIELAANKINKSNLEEYIEMFQEAILEGRGNQELEIVNNSDTLIKIMNGAEDEALINADKEAKLFVFTAQLILETLELDNKLLNPSEDEVNNINFMLNNFVTQNVIGDWYYKDDLDWREKDVKTLQ